MKFKFFWNLNINWQAVFGALILAACWVLMIVAALLVLTSCTTTKYVEVERVHTDTLKITKHQRDSIWLHDSVLVDKSGDTIRIEKWHTKYVEKQIHDTLYQSKTDSIPVPYPVEKLVEKELTWWQKTQMYVGDALMIGVLLALFIYSLKFKKKLLG